MAKEIELKLLCDLTEDEVRMKAQEVGVLIAEYDRVEAQKKLATKEFGEQLDGLRQRTRELSAQITSRTEGRMVRCVVEMHVPEVRRKRIVRLDTGEIVREEWMSDEECQQRFFEAEPAPQGAREEAADGEDAGEDAGGGDAGKAEQPRGERGSGDGGRRRGRRRDPGEGLSVRDRGSD